MKNLTTLLFLMINGSVLAQFEVPDKEVKRILPNDDYITKDTEYKKKYFNLETDRIKLREQNKIIKSELEKLRRNSNFSDVPNKKYEVPVPQKNTKKFITRGRKYSSGIQTFAYSEENSFVSTALPAGSWVKGTMLNGLMVSSKSAQEVIIQLDFGFTGPNGSKIMLNGCNVIGIGKADLSIERILITPITISCVKSNGKHFTRDMHGFVAGEDSYNGLSGVYSSKQGKVFLAAVLAGIVQGATQAYDMTNIQSTILGAGGDNPVVSKKFTGKMGTYAAMKGLQSGANLTTQWYLEMAKSLLPSISKGSGSKVWVLTTKSIYIPQLEENLY